MWEIKYTTKFKKDLKRIKNQPDRLSGLKTVLKQLEEKGTVDASYNPHPLTGNYKDCIECHIQNDFLLIWMDSSTNTINLVRLGSHSELFK